MQYGFPKGAETFPKMVVVNTAYVCNAACVHCIHTIDPSSRKVVGPDVFVRPEVFRKLADECGLHGAYIRVTGTGEPLLHPELLPLIRYAKEKGCKVSMITNGSLLTPDKADYLLDAGLDGFEFSVDAMSAETYEKVRRKLSFSVLLENISYLRARRDALKYPAFIVCSFVEEELNRHERHLAEAFWVPRYVDKIQFRVWLQYGKMGATEDRRSLMAEREPCPYPFERINMDSQGRFHLCAFDIDHKSDFGSLMGRPLKEIWRDPELDNIREQLLARQFDAIPLCSECTDWGCRSWTHNYWKIVTDAKQSAQG